MSFFDKKEEVIEIQLTQYGKHLLSRGKFSPKMYAFFDDDLVYDLGYAGLTEEQSEIQERIEGSLPRLKTQYVFSSREREVKRLTAALVSGKVDLQDRIIQPTADRHYALSAPLGNSSIGVNKAPSWNINFLKGETHERVEFLSGAMPTMKIPQLNLKPITYKTMVWSDIPPDGSFSGSSRVGDIYGTGTEGDLSITISQFDDGSYISIQEDFALIDVREMNSDFKNENFDIEVFLVEEVDSQDNIVPLSLRGSIESREKLYPLSFMEQRKYIKDGFLLDEPEGGPADEIPEVNPNYVEYWFNIWVDDEIDERVMKAICYETEGDKNIYMEQETTKCADLDGGPVAPESDHIIYGSAGRPSLTGGIVFEGSDSDGEGCDD